jgi:hypothetical protein
MKSAAHTPGPWKAQLLGVQDTTVEMSDGHVFHIGGEEQGIDTVDANAHLIAAAPLMLAALERVVWYLDKDDDQAVVQSVVAALQATTATP